MAGPINLKLLPDFFNKIDPSATSDPGCLRRRISIVTMLMRGVGSVRERRATESVTLTLGLSAVLYRLCEDR